MIIDGRALAESVYADIKLRVEERSVQPHLTIFTCAPNQATQQYLDLKKRKAKEVGIAVNVIEFPAEATTEALVQSVTQAQMQTDGIVVQLPLPEHIDVDEVINAVPVSYDVDGMHYDGTGKTVMSPVTAAIAHIVAHDDILLATQHVVVIGNGQLVGKPTALWLQTQGAHVTVLTKDHSAEEVKGVVAHADGLVLGAGQAGLIVPDMIQSGVFLFDAGTSEDGGELKGDADPACAEKAALFTPVPGGIGPLTIAMLLRNLIDLMERQ